MPSIEQEQYAEDIMQFLSGVGIRYRISEEQLARLDLPIMIMIPDLIGGTTVSYLPQYGW